MKNYAQERTQNLGTRYGVSTVPNTASTGADSPRVNYKDLVNKPTGTSSPLYSGYVVSGGTAGAPFPSGWTVTSLGTGAYQVTHNLGTTNYIVVATPLITSVVVRIVNIFNITSTAFDLEIFDASGTSQNIGVFFILTTQSNP